MKSEKEFITAIRQSIVNGDREQALEQTRAAIESGVNAKIILDDGLTKGADIVGKQFEKGECFLPELMLTGIALKEAMEIVILALKEQQEAVQQGVVVMATIQSDVHDIGKNLVSSMLSASGFIVHDLGVDVAIDQIINQAIAHQADLIGCSALLTTSTPYLRDLISTIEERGVRERFKIIIGGACITQEFATAIGSDGTAADAIGAVKLAKQLIG